MPAQPRVIVCLTPEQVRALAADLYHQPFRDPRTPGGGAWNLATDRILLAAERRGLLPNQDR